MLEKLLQSFLAAPVLFVNRWNWVTWSWVAWSAIARSKSFLSLVLDTQSDRAQHLHGILQAGPPGCMDCLEWSPGHTFPRYALRCQDHRRNPRRSSCCKRDFLDLGSASYSQQRNPPDNFQSAGTSLK
jgi:hypothetical protein